MKTPVPRTPVRSAVKPTSPADAPLPVRESFQPEVRLFTGSTASGALDSVAPRRLDIEAISEQGQTQIKLGEWRAQVGKDGSFQLRGKRVNEAAGTTLAVVMEGKYMRGRLQLYGFEERTSGPGGKTLSTFSLGRLHRWLDPGATTCGTRL